LLIGALKIANWGDDRSGSHKVSPFWSVQLKHKLRFSKFMMFYMTVAESPQDKE
jgi:hypothetical protein